MVSAARASNAALVKLHASDVMEGGCLTLTHLAADTVSTSCLLVSLLGGKEIFLRIVVNSSRTLGVENTCLEGLKITSLC